MSCKLFVWDIRLQQQVLSYRLFVQDNRVSNRFKLVHAANPIQDCGSTQSLTECAIINFITGTHQPALTDCPVADFIRCPQPALTDCAVTDFVTDCAVADFITDAHQPAFSHLMKCWKEQWDYFFPPVKFPGHHTGTFGLKLS